MRIEPAYAALADLIAARLVACGFLERAAALKIDPPAPYCPSGEETELQTSAALVQAETKPVRTLLGIQPPRYVVERECQLELTVAGPELDLDGRGRQLMQEGGAVLALLVRDDPTLGGSCERCDLTGRTDQEVPPNGVGVVLTFVLRVRAADALGLTD